MSYRDLFEECERHGMGPLLWGLLVEVAGRVAGRYPPKVYSDTERWSEESIRDLAQDVALDRLIGENQLEYVLDQATDEDSLSRLLAFQVRRTLAGRRSITVVDRLLARVREFDLETIFRVTGLGAYQFISPRDSGREPASLSEADVRRGSVLIAPIPRIASRPDASRESKVYSGRNLMEVVRVLVREFDGISLHDLRRILEITLTAWLPTILQIDEEGHVEPSIPELEVERSEMSTLIGDFVTDLGSEHRTVLLGKAQGLADDDLATHMGRSRPWIADRKREVFEMVDSRVMSRLPSALHSEAAWLLVDEAAALEAHDD